MHQIIYLSSCVKYLNVEEIGSLLSKCRKNNLEKDITGALLYIEGDFLQVIEGPEVALLELFESIKKDKRHKGIITIVNTKVSKRNFPKWNMGFCSFDFEELKKMKGYENMDQANLAEINDKTALTFINSFIKTHQNKFVFV
jgi:hypothetical protein